MCVTERSIRLAIVDDDALVRAGLRMILGGDAAITIVGEAADGREALDMIAARMKEARDENWEEDDEGGKKLRRSQAVSSIGGATIDNEENYLITKLFHSMGFTRITNQARI